ncbi:GntR family transcriptional regulator [Ruminococcus sp. OA3]|uniref:GntR family transcriptional regulator n=1 Tax=Ruminococcus sp. OA3 TaxID=2914164 RepID=UPI001F06A245|nr:GntR family transcriptional regulator [Ruminococcus sp. OA3]MCH1980980.1 GntR family transcriptional regulator [Ruminococcus sp. OA3]
MKNGEIKYEKFYHILKKKIVCGLLADGSRLPSRAEMCREFCTSEKTVRRVLEMLAAEGLVETRQRKRPMVTFDAAASHKRGLLSLQKADETAAADIFKTGILICYPVISYGISLCSDEGWAIPESLLEKMDPEQPKEFWRLSNQFWRFFVSRSENELILRAVDSLGLSELDPLPGTLQIREDYYEGLKKLTQVMKCGGDLNSVHFADLSSLYGFVTDEKQRGLFCRVASDSPLRLGRKELQRRISSAEEQYSRVYLDLLGLIAIGRYKPGDRLPSHEELRRAYGVSVDTTMKAVQLLKAWGIVTATRGKGIFVAMDLEAMSKIYIEPELIARHIRRYLDSLQMLSLTIEGVAAHAAAQVTAEEACSLCDSLEDVWNHAYLYQLSPVILLEFLVAHIQYDALQTIYEVILKNYHIGRSIPKLISHKKNRNNYEIHKQCLEAARILTKGDSVCFARKASEMFQHTNQLIITECKRLEYWEAAVQVYDGSVLWK